MRSVPLLGLVTMFLVSLILFPCFAPACADSPPPFARVELKQNYSTRNIIVSEIDSVDFMDFDNAKVDIFSTTGDNSDIKELQFPHFRDIRRVFSKNTTTWEGNSLRILGVNDSTVDWSTYTEYTVFISRYLPRVHIEVPDTVANVVLFKVNASTGITDIRSLLSSSERAYLFNSSDGMLVIKKDSPYPDWYWDFDIRENDLAYTFDRNDFDLSSFTLDQTLAQLVSGLNPMMYSGTPPIAGEYILYAFRYDPGPPGRVTTYSSWPVVIMDGDNPLVFPSVYDKSSGQDPVLTFDDASDIHNISYVLIKTGETDDIYDMRIDVNMSALEEEGAAHISSVLISNPLLALLKNPDESIGSIGKVVSYSITRDGSPPPPPPEHPWQIAITPGYGISGYARDSASVVIPHEDLSTLVTGTFSVYAMGLDAHNNIIALDQQYLEVIESPIAAFHAVPTHGPAPLDVQFHDDSQGSPTSWDWDFGDESPHSDEQNPSHTYTAPGSYTVTLTVSNDFGSDDEEDNIVATGSPILPHSFYGNVTLHGSPAPVNTEIEAQGEGVIIGEMGNPIQTEETGVYGGPEPFDPKLIVQGEIKEYTDLRFYVDGSQAMCRDANTSNGWLWTYRFSPGTVTNLDLTVPAEPLEADFKGTPRSGHAPLEVQFNDLSIGNPDQWSWNFGDGGTSSKEDPVHTYAAPGSYTVSLTVHDASGNHDTETRQDYITATEPPSPPVAQFKANQTSGSAPLAVAFTDLSTGSPYLWTWNFGDDDTSSQQNPVHVYDSPGTYTVHLSVRNAGGTDTETKTNYITVSEPPLQANFVADKTSGPAPLTVTFSDLSTGNPDSWSWTFGDGGSSGQQNPIHVYDNPGTYTVSLTVENPVGTDSLSRPDYITVTGGDLPPVADFTADRTSGYVPLVVQFTDTSTNNPDSWSWEFGDGSTSGMQNPGHTYTEPGTYTVELGVTNEFGSDTISRPGYISAYLPPEYFYIDATAGPGGKIEPSGLVAVPPGGSKTFLITATSGYSIQNIMVDGDAEGVITQYTFPDVFANHTIFATFRQYGGGGGGGGGGSGTFYIGGIPTTTPTTAIPTTAAPAGSLPLGHDNLTTQTVVLVSSDGGASITIKQGTRPLDGSGQPLRTLDIADVLAGSLPPAPGDGYRYSGYTYIVSPQGASFDPAATLTITPTAGDWERIKDYELVIMRYNPAGGAWEALPTTIDRDAATVSAPVSSGGIYSLFHGAEKAPTPEQTTTQVPTTPVFAGFPWLMVAIGGVIILLVVIAIVYLVFVRPEAGRPPDI